MNRNFKHFLDGYMEYSQCSEAPDIIHTYTAISITAAALERKVWLGLGNKRFYPSCYIFVLGEPGGTRKSSATQLGVRILENVGEPEGDQGIVKFMANQITAAAMVADLKASEKEFNLNKYQFKCSPMYIYNSELASFVKEISGSLSELLTDLWDNREWFEKSLKSDGRTFVIGPTLNWLACSTISWLHRAIPEEEIKGGFASRILFVVVTRNQDRQPIAFPELIDTGDLFNKLKEDLDMIYNLAGPMDLTSSAQAYYKNWYENVHKPEIMEIKNEIQRALINRRDAYVKKFGMINSAMRSNDLVIEAQDFEQGVKWYQMIEANMMQAFQYNRNELYEHGQKVLDDITKAGGTSTYSDILQNHMKDLTHKELSLIIEDLRLADKVEVEASGHQQVVRLRTSRRKHERPSLIASENDTRLL